MQAKTTPPATTVREPQQSGSTAGNLVLVAFMPISFALTLLLMIWLRS